MLERRDVAADHLPAGLLGDSDIKRELNLL